MQSYVRTRWLGVLGSALLAWGTWAAPAGAQESDYDNVDYEVTSENDDGPRLRLGMEFGVGGAVGGTEGAVIGAIGQLGVQLNDWVGLYYQPTFYAGGFGDRDEVEAQGVYGTGQGAMVVLDILSFVEVGAGGGYFLGRIGECSAIAVDCQTGRYDAPIFTARAAFIIPFNVGRGRLGIPISFNAQTVFDDDRITTLVAAVGVQGY